MTMRITHTSASREKRSRNIPARDRVFVPKQRQHQERQPAHPQSGGSFMQGGKRDQQHTAIHARGGVIGHQRSAQHDDRGNQQQPRRGFRAKLRHQQRGQCSAQNDGSRDEEIRADRIPQTNLGSRHQHCRVHIQVQRLDEDEAEDADPQQRPRARFHPLALLRISRHIAGSPQNEHDAAQQKRLEDERARPHDDRQKSEQIDQLLHLLELLNHRERDFALAHVPVSRQHVPLQLIGARFQAGGLALQHIGSGLLVERERRG